MKLFAPGTHFSFASLRIFIDLSLCFWDVNGFGASCVDLELQRRFFLVYLCDNVLLAGSGELCCWGLGELMIVSISFSG